MLYTSLFIFTMYNMGEGKLALSSILEGQSLFMIVFIYGLLNKSVSNSEYIASNGRMINKL
jgi:hypothetical protein